MSKQSTTTYTCAGIWADGCISSETLADAQTAALGVRDVLAQVRHRRAHVANGP